MCAIPAGLTELIAGDLGAAEQILRQGAETLHAMGERGYRSTAVAFLAEALYAQGRLDEAQRLTEDAEALAGAADVVSQAQWRATRAKLLARRGESGAAARLADEALAQILPTSSAPLLGEVLTAKAQVLRLAGAPGDAETSLRRALQLFEDRRMTPLAERTRALLAGLTAQRGPPALQ
jgi:ATP/maltotriose-dependent transcriptional regulator MalT